MRRIAERQQTGLDDTYGEITALRRRARNGDHLYSSSRNADADALQAKIPDMERAVKATYDDIRIMTEAMSDTDLAYL